MVEFWLSFARVSAVGHAGALAARRKNKAHKKAPIFFVTVARADGRAGLSTKNENIKATGRNILGLAVT